MPDSDMLSNGFFDEPRTAENSRALEAWLQADPNNVVRFVDCLLIHNDLQRFVLAEDLSSYQNGGHKPAADDSCLLVERADEIERVLKQGDSVGGLKGLLHSKARGTAIAALAVAAGLLVAVSLSVPLRQLQEVASEESAPAETSLRIPEANRRTSLLSDFVATFSDAEECVWSDAANVWSFGDHLRSGAKVDLASGIVQLSFETGAVLVVEGPCRLVVQDNAVQVTRGKVSATVPRQASGFSVTTPTSHVIDLGTEIGVDVGPTGDTEVHVFRGEVVSRQLDQEGNPIGDFVRLTANSAISFRHGSEAAKRFAANELAFVRRLHRESIDRAARTPPVDANIRMWLAADHRVLLDDANRVIAWRDSLTSGADAVSDNALQPVEEFRPQYVSKALNGRPALRFDGQDDCLVTTPVTSADSQTVAFVASLSQTSVDQGQLINYNGPPQIPDAQNRQLGVLQIRACMSQGRPLLDPYVFVKDVGSEMLFVGRMEEACQRISHEKSLPELDKPVIGVYVYNYEANHAAFYLNGTLIGESTAPLPASITSRKVIGRHGGWRRYFAGLVAELMIIDEGLDEPRVSSVTQYLGDKYGIGVE